MTDEDAPGTIRYVYRFQFPDRTEKVFEVALDGRTLELQHRPVSQKPDWAKLTYHQCANCPLSQEEAYCPVAANLSEVVEAFKDSISYDRALVTVETAERTYMKETTLQRGLSSIIGIYMVTSNCPVMDNLRPMALVHLPFASSNETVYRSVSTYLLRQHFLMRKGHTPDWELHHLGELYAAIDVVNRGFSNRLCHASRNDANVNAVINLAMLGQLLSFSLDAGLKDLEALFSPPGEGGH